MATASIRYIPPIGGKQREELREQLLEDFAFFFDRLEAEHSGLHDNYDWPNAAAKLVEILWSDPVE